MFTPESQFSRYQALVSHLAQGALHAAQRRAPADPAPGALSAALPLARGRIEAGDLAPDAAALLDAAQRLAQGPARLTTLTGQSRPVYFPLAAHLLIVSLPSRDRQDAIFTRDQCEALDTHLDALSAALSPAAFTRQTIALVLWQALVNLEIGAWRDERDRIDQSVARIEEVARAAPAGEQGPLHAQTGDDQLDHWTYRELSGLHALTNAALHCRRDDWWTLAQRVAHFHLEHTQPDYTTYEPWAVHAFLRWPDTMVLADQQLHDTETNLHLGGETVALLPGLLLADATRALNEPRFGAPPQETTE